MGMGFRWTVAAILAAGVAGLLLWGPADLDQFRYLLLGLLFVGAAAMAIYDWIKQKGSGPGPRHKSGGPKTKGKRGKQRGKTHSGTYF